MNRISQTSDGLSEAPAVAQGRAALAAPLVHFAGYDFVVQCATPTCHYRRFPVAQILARRSDLTVAEALDRFRCGPCDEPAVIAGMARANVSTGEHWLLLRGQGLRWR